MVELVYKFDKKSTISFYKGEFTAKVLQGHIHINISESMVVLSI